MKNTAYYNALEADRQFSMAIKKQFGEKASRWDHDNCDYNADTKNAYNHKIKMDELNLVKFNFR